MEKYCKQSIVEYNQCDLYGKIKLADLLRQAQQISMEQCNQLGIGNEFMGKIQKVFLLAKIRLQIHRLPMAEEEMTIETIPYGVKRAQYQRLTNFMDKEGKVMVEMDSRWVLVDTTTFKILRRLPKEIELPFAEPGEQTDIRISKIKGEEKFSHNVPVQYSQLDINRHLNNTEYGNIICNCIEENLMEGQKLKEVTILYHSEARWKENLKIYCIYPEGENDTVQMKGMKEQGICFEAEVVLT